MNDEQFRNRRACNEAKNPEICLRETSLSHFSINSLARYPEEGQRILFRD
jgi:hypothetical protein